MEKSETITIQATSDWHYSQSDAEIQCDERLDSLESEEISRAESNGGKYVGGTTYSYSIEYNSSSEEYKCSRERTLEFIFIEEQILESDIEEIEYEDFKVDDLKISAEKIASEPTVDVTKQLEQLIKPKVPQTVLHEEVRVGGGGGFPGGFPGGGGGGRFPRVRIRRVNLPLSKIVFTNLNIISSNLTLDSNAYTVNIPTTETVLHIPYSNCGSNRQTIKRDIEFKVVRGWKIDFTKKITSSTKVGGKLKFGSIGEADIEHRLTTEITNHKSISETKDEILRTSFQFTVESFKITDILLTVQNFEARRNFSGPITLEGEVQLIYGSGQKVIKHNLSGLLNNNERTMDISGYYANISWEELPVKITEKDCPN